MYIYVHTCIHTYIYIYIYISNYQHCSNNSYVRASQLPQGNTSGRSGCESELDECNGKVLSDGTYVYFVTPVYPFLPQCLKGAKLGVLTQEPYPNIIKVSLSSLSFSSSPCLSHFGSLELS